MGAFRSHDGKVPIFVRVVLERRELSLLSLCRAVFYQLKHLVFAVHAELLIDVRDVPMPVLQTLEGGPFRARKGLVKLAYSFCAEPLCLPHSGYPSLDVFGLQNRPRNGAWA